MRILITGNLGYVGPVVVQRLRQTYPDAFLIGADTGYFSGCTLDSLSFPEKHLNQQFYSDLRHLPSEVFRGVDAVVHLAAISNDPMGNQFEAITHQVNFESSVEVARKARAAGVRAFVFASSCSVYGSAEETPRTEQSGVQPLTAYARSKVAMESALGQLAGRDFTVTCLRFATACGMSPRLRLDLVLNDFVAAAVSTGKIQVLSDGTPWRPLIHVRDMARAMEWAIARAPGCGGEFLVVNTGNAAWTFQVKDLAFAVAAAFPHVDISINHAAPADRRSYKVDFGLFETLAPLHQPQEDLTGTILELKHHLVRFFRQNPPESASRLVRLKVLFELLKEGHLTRDLLWARPLGLSIPTEELVLAG